MGESFESAHKQWQQAQKNEQGIDPTPQTQGFWPRMQKLGSNIVNQVMSSFPQPYERAPDMVQANNMMLTYSEHGSYLAPFYAQALETDPALRTVGINHYHHTHLYGAHPSFLDGRHGVHMPLHADVFFPSKEIAQRYPIAEEVSQDWLDVYATDEQTQRLMNSLSFVYELGRASLQVGFNGRATEYYSLILEGVETMPFRFTPLHEIDTPQNRQFAHEERTTLEENFGMSNWGTLAALQQKAYRALPREQYAEGFVRHVVKHVDLSLAPEVRKAWGLVDVGYTRDNGAS
jgi:hypothetical protein